MGDGDGSGDGDDGSDVNGHTRRMIIGVEVDGSGGVGCQTLLHPSTVYDPLPRLT